MSVEAADALIERAIRAKGFECCSEDPASFDAALVDEDLEHMAAAG